MSLSSSSASVQRQVGRFLQQGSVNPPQPPCGARTQTHTASQTFTYFPGSNPQDRLRTWKGDGEATNKNTLVCYVSKRRGPRGEKIRLRKDRRDQEREGAKRPPFFLKRSAYAPKRSIIKEERS